MTILLVSEVFPPKHGGSGRWFWELYRRLPRETVHIAANDWPEAEGFDRTHDLPISRIPLQFSHWGLFRLRGVRAYLRAARALRSVVRKVQPRVLHCGRCLPEGFLARGLRLAGGPPYWCYVHGEELTYAQTSRELGWMARRSFRGAERIVANSRNTREMLMRDWQVPAERITVVHPGVDTTAFTPADRDPASRVRLGWGNRPVVLTVGALSERKGQDTMIRALPAIRRAVPDVLYSVAGEGWERARLEHLAVELGVADAVQFRGTPTDAELVECYRQCDLFTLPNRRAGCDVEGFGIVLLEAQACGKPVIAGKSGGTAETMKIPETGVVIDCTTPDRLAEVVVEWLRDPVLREKMGRAARQWVVERFDWSILVEQASTLFNDNALPSSKSDRPYRPRRTSVPTQRLSGRMKLTEINVDSVQDLRGSESESLRAVASPSAPQVAPRGSLAERILFWLAHRLYKTELAHSAAMKSALTDPLRYAEYRANEIGRIVNAAGRYGVELAGVLLDIGCNDGVLTQQYRKCGPRKVIGVDVDETAIRRARIAPASEGIEFLAFDGRTLPLADSSVDTIVSYDVFEHIPKPIPLLRECKRVLRPGGRMLIGTWGWRHPFAPHLWSVMPVPWAHLIVSERSLFKVCRRVHQSPWYVPTMFDVDENGKMRPDRFLEEAIPPDYLNKFLIRDFRTAFQASGFRFRVHLEPFGARLVKWPARLLTKLPWIREFAHGYMWAVLE